MNLFLPLERASIKHTIGSVKLKKRANSELSFMKILVTGSAGFIGFHVTQKLLERGDEVVGLDNVNDYYDPQLKYARLKETGIPQNEVDDHKLIQSSRYNGYRFVKMNLEDTDALLQLCVDEKFDAICHLAAQAGVRYSIENPMVYVNSNMVGFANVLEGARHSNCKHLVYASSSSVYGLNEQMPFNTSQNVDHPISLYAASKKSNELMAHTYSHLFNIPTTGLRFFTVYGPWGRPDMAMFLFTKAIIEGKPIKVFNNGNMKRDFTYVDDIVEGVIKVIDQPAQPNTAWSGLRPESKSSKAPYRLYNIGNNNPVLLTDFIEQIEKNLEVKAIRDLLPLQEGDVPVTWADVDDLKADVGYEPTTQIDKGVAEFVKWYKGYYHP